MDAAPHGGEGAALPPETVLMAQLGARRAELREALGQLVAEGLIVRRRGLGTRVVGEHSPMDLCIPGPGTSLECHLGAGAVSPHVVSWSWVRSTPAPIATRLRGVTSGDRTLRIDYVFHLGDEPIGVITNYVRAVEAGRLDRSEFTADFYSIIGAASATGLGAHDLVLNASRADEFVAAVLGIAPGDPVTAMDQVIRNTDGDGIVVAFMHFRSDVRLQISGIPRVTADRAGSEAGAPPPAARPAWGGF
ncbi:GntR family transcriptional regulator [Streptomyces sp. NPDC050625]|uniref:GntR family transcriptional regulator n=1 Tax=Streptomyces sp. NPDC050625 TaxID=3154629 RepID=UPI00344A4F01